jgi:predicted secreted protein
MAKYAGSTVTFSIDPDGLGYDAIAQIVDIGEMPGIEADDIEVSDRDSGWGAFISGMKMAGECAMDIVYDPDATSHQQLVTLAAAGTEVDFKFTLPGTTNTIEVAGYVKRFRAKAPLKDKLAADITLKFTGAPTMPS